MEGCKGGPVDRREVIDTVVMIGKDIKNMKNDIEVLKKSVNGDNRLAELKIPTQSMKITDTLTSTIKDIGTDIGNLQDSISKINSDIIEVHNEINTLRRQNKALSDKLADSRSRIVILEENYNSIVEDLAQSTKIDLFIYTAFAICIAVLAYEVYILTH